MREINKIKIFLQMSRAGSFPILFVPLMILFLVNQPLLSIYSVLIFVLAFLLHTATVFHNQVMDYYWDKKDMSKQHFPLINGTLKYESMVVVSSWYLLIVCLLSVLSCFVFPGNKIYSLFFISVAWIGGHCYNDFGFSKYSYVSWIPITIYVISISSVGYFWGTQNMGDIYIPIMLCIVFREWFQISYSGKIKEIETTEKSEIKKMGAHIFNGYFHPGFSFLYTFVLTCFETAVALYIFFTFTYRQELLPIIFLFLAAGWITFFRITLPRRFIRKKELSYLTGHEIIFIFLIAVILSPLVGYLEVLFVLLVSIMWFVVCNKIIFGESYTKF